jgi:soluble lytic murein transglycosylase
MVSDNSSYNYFKFESSFKSIPIDRINEIDKKEFRKLIMLSIPRHLKKRFRPYLAHTLEIAEKYEVDPFWVLAIMWTESHFNIKAKSYVSATGLMQIMPGTGRFLARLMKRPHSHKIAMELVKDPKTNIEMGAFYLKRLVRSFDHNYRLATVAYNMGPGGVRSRIRRNLPVGVRNNYLDKVTGFHKKLTAPFTKAVLSTKRPYMSTFVIKRYHRAETISLKSFFKKLDSYIMPRGVRYAALKSQIFLL